MKRILVTSFVLLLILAGHASAAVITDSASVSLQTTNWNYDLSIDQFDSSLGTLNSVYFELYGTVEGSAQYENTSDGPSNYQLNLQAEITLKRPDDTTITIVQVIPLANQSGSVGGFDGVIDFGGTSGVSFDDLFGEDTQSSTYTTLVDMTPFIGTGEVLLPIAATATSFATDDTGNVISSFSTQASAELLVRYDYTSNEVPVPAAIWLLGSGLLGLVGYRSRKRKA